MMWDSIELVLIFTLKRDGAWDQRFALFNLLLDPLLAYPLRVDGLPVDDFGKLVARAGN